MFLVKCVQQPTANSDISSFILIIIRGYIYNAMFEADVSLSVHSNDLFVFK